MIVAREKAGDYGFFEETFQQKRVSGRRSVIKADKIALMLFVFAIFGVGIFVITYFVQVSALGFKIDRFHRDLAVLRVENHALEEQVQHLAALNSVENAATGVMEMVKPNVGDYMLLPVSVAIPEIAAVETTGLGMSAGAANSMPEELTNVGDSNPFLHVFDRLANIFAGR